MDYSFGGMIKLFVLYGKKQKAVYLMQETSEGVLLGWHEQGLSFRGHVLVCFLLGLPSSSFLASASSPSSVSNSMGRQFRVYLVGIQFSIILFALGNTYHQFSGF